MPVDTLPAFDAIAADYDRSFSQGLTGTSQRMQVRKWLMEFLSGKKSLRILEINCGTGDDAIWLSSLGHKVTASDGSVAMIEQAQQKNELTNADVSFHHCSFANLMQHSNQQLFDLIFSNFSGLNCIDENEMSLMNERLSELLTNDGHIAVVIFGKYSWWEMIYYLLKLKPQTAFRRWKKKSAVSVFNNTIYQQVYYYSLSRFCRLMDHFKLETKKPVGLFVPPSYLEIWMQRKKRLFRFLNKLEQKAGGTSAFSQLSDHTYLLLKKN